MTIAPRSVGGAVFGLQSLLPMTNPNPKSINGRLWWHGKLDVCGVLLVFIVLSTVRPGLNTHSVDVASMIVMIGS